MGISLTKCYRTQNMDEVLTDNKREFNIVKEEKKLILKSSPKSYAKIIDQKSSNKLSQENKLPSENSEFSTLNSNNRKSHSKNNSIILNTNQINSEKSFLKDETNKFIIFKNSHRQISFLCRSFKNKIDANLNMKLDHFLENEYTTNKLMFPDLDFTIEAIVEFDNSSKSNFLIISNIFLYELEYITELSLIRKLNILLIDFFTITTNYTNLIINSQEENFRISHLDSLQIVFCICNILFYCHSITKHLIIIPESLFKTCREVKNNDFFRFYNDYSFETFNLIGSLIPFDIDENFIKFIPVLKIETKFIDKKVEKIVILTNKKLLEITLNGSNIGLSQINIIPFSKMRKIFEFNKSSKFQIIMEDGTCNQYSTINSIFLVQLIKHLHSNECLLELELIKEIIE